MAKILSVEENKEIKFWNGVIGKTMDSLLKNGGVVGLYYLTPPTSKAVKLAVMKHFKGSLEISFARGGVHMKDIRVAIKKPR